MHLGCVANDTRNTQNCASGQNDTKVSPPLDRHGDWPMGVVGCALVESLVRPMRVVMPRILEQHPDGVVPVVDQDAVGALSADSAHELLA
jgi:hypothetical protein